MPYFGNNPSPLLLNTVAQNGKEMTLDADADTSITADTDDQIDIKIGGADDFQFTANTFTAQSGSTIAAQALTATTITASGVLDITDTTDSSDATGDTGALRTEGGASIAKKLFVGTDLDVDGTANLDAVDIDGNVDIAGTTALKEDVVFHGDNYNVTWDKSDSALEFGDNAKLTFGAGNDLQIYHTPGTGTFIDEADDGSLFIRSSRVTMHKYTGETMINAAADGAVSLYYDDSKKLETVSNGIEIYNGSSGQNPNIFLKDMNSGVVSGDEGGGIYYYTNDSNGTGNNLAIIQKFENSAGGAGMAFETGTGTSRSERMRLDANGNLGIGTNSPNSGYRIHAYNSSGGAGVLAEGAGTGNESYFQLKFVNSSGTSRTAMMKGDNGDTLRIASANPIGIGMETSDSQALSLGSDGSLRLQHVYDDTTGNSANMYIHSDGTHQVMRSTSSERYKKNVETLEDKYADAVLGLRPVWYKSKCEADNPDYSYWGLIAEEVAKVDPRLVTFRNEYTEDIGDGKWKVVKLDAPQAESVQYDRLVPHLINICKRQEDKITALEAKVKTLEEA